MTDDPDEAARRKARADKLRAQIQRLKGGGAPPPDEDTTPESARDFVERKMRDLDDKAE
ncbi:hypothetical protein [Phenylobacterium sp.]|uniref:hypothetical protein n=1 Tax=Phenylobacterium sp. TaxID=1871053 RepID=UPI003BAAE234